MNRTGPVIIIEDDFEDQQVLQEVFGSLQYGHEIIFFSDGFSALQYLTETSVEPFIIFSDINMPKLTGIELRQKVHENEDLRLKSIPYLFFSTSAEQKHVVDAYSKSAQGFFVKPKQFEEIKDLIKVIMDYWLKCVSPNYIK
ncbi:MAG TPA: response regulator [Flavobacterium sp.]|jgi:CheY-like chemotaxis protein